MVIENSRLKENSANDKKALNMQNMIQEEMKTNNAVLLNENSVLKEKLKVSVVDE